MENGVMYMFIAQTKFARIQSHFRCYSSNSLLRRPPLSVALFFATSLSIRNGFVLHFLIPSPTRRSHRQRAWQRFFFGRNSLICCAKMESENYLTTEGNAIERRRRKGGRQSEAKPRKYIVENWRRRSRSRTEKRNGFPRRNYISENKIIK